MGGNFIIGVDNHGKLCEVSQGNGEPGPLRKPAHPCGGVTVFE